MHPIQVARPRPYSVSVAEEGGRHWTDDEVRALLCVWGDRKIRERLKSTLRNKSIFQEMARQMQRKFGVVRNWKQCRTKYKNLKYDYKTAKSAHAAGGGGTGGAGGPGKYMKFFDEVEAILLDQELKNGMAEMGKKLYEVEMGGGEAAAPTAASESEIVIEIDDGTCSSPARATMVTMEYKKYEVHSSHHSFSLFFFFLDENSDDYDMDADLDVKWTETGETGNGR